MRRQSSSPPVLRMPVRPPVQVPRGDLVNVLEYETQARLVLGAALWMQWGGLSAAMGAFVAGVMLAESSFRHQLEADVEPFKGLLLGLFFLAVGMSLDLGVLAAQWRAIALMVLAFMALKALAIAVVARLFKASGAEALERAVLMAQGGEFAFVLYASAAGLGVLSDTDNAVFTAVVMLSMALTPVVAGLHQAWVRQGKREALNPPAMDTEMEHSPVIIAGFGRFGQVVGRLMLSNGLGTTVMDNDPRHIENLRPFGFRVYYGDATRLDLLRAAGAEQAKVLVVAVDDREAALAIVAHARAVFPHLELVVRAYDVPHYYALKAAGVQHAVREVFEGSLQAGQQVLRCLGLSEEDSARRVGRFRDTNQQQVDEFAEHARTLPRKDFIEALRASREELERQLRQDRGA